MGIEQRQFPRLNVSFRAVILLPDDKKLFVKINNISEGGVGFLCPENFALGQMLNVVMEVPSLNNPAQRAHLPCKIRIQHNVLSQQEYRLGAQIVEMDEKHKALFRSWLNRGGG